MKEKVEKNAPKVVNIDSIRQKKGGKVSRIALLHDTRQASHAIQHKTCLLCRERKLCVNKTGLCAACYSALSPREKQVADEEAQHKIIEISVTDDRWKRDKDP